MKIRLPVKIFLAFLGVSIASIGMVVVANHYFSNRNFESYLQFKGLKTLGLFAETLAETYETYQGWETLRNDPDIWASLVRERWPSDENIPTVTGTDDFLGTDASLATEYAVAVFPFPGEITQDESYGRLYPHITLFNLEKEVIVGEGKAFDELSILPVTVDGTTVGWVGLAFGEKLSHPLDLEFMNKQSRVFQTIGAVVLLIAIVIAFLLTKHLLAPIKRLSVAAEALGERAFKTRIPIRSKDELGALAIRFNTMAQKLETYEQNQKQWLSDISHELRTPLSVLIGEITALQEGVRKPDKASLASLCDEAKHLSKIVEDLHYLSLSEAGMAPPRKRIIKPLPVLSQAIYFYENRLKDAGMSMEVTLDAASVDLEMNADRDRLMQLFTNLLENAVMHANKPGTLFVNQTTNSDGCLRIVFEDTGPGVSKEALPRLFDRLYRADPSRSRKTGSSGLGLAICKTIVSNHNGEILAQHSEKGGLKVDIHLPVLSN